MKILVVDDERPALESLCAMLRRVEPGCELTACLTAREALEAARETPFDAAFLDIELGTTSGLALAKELKEVLVKISIIFTTAYSEYAVAAFALHATGYLLKPVQEEDLRRELTFLYGERFGSRKRVRIQTFDGFEVYVDGKALSFGRQKSRELLAYLVMRRGAGVHVRDACGILFEDKPYDMGAKSYFRTILAELKHTLRDAGAEDLLVKNGSLISVNADLIDCDYYRFLEGDAQAVNAYHGEFMPCFSWAEFASGDLQKRRNGHGYGK